MKRPFCWVVVPDQNELTQVIHFWSAVGHLTAEGKDVLSHMPNEQTLNLLEEKSVQCDELIIVGLDKWHKDPWSKSLKKWAEAKKVLVRVMDPESWKEIAA